MWKYSTFQQIKDGLKRMKKIKVVFLDVETGKAPQVLEIEDKLDSYLETLRIDTIDIVKRNIAGNPYQIVCDDEGLLKEDPTLSAVDLNNVGALVGNIIITGLTDYEGNLTSLNEKDVDRIMQRFKYTLNLNKGWNMVLVID